MQDNDDENPNVKPVSTSMDRDVVNKDLVDEQVKVAENTLRSTIKDESLQQTSEAGEDSWAVASQLVREFRPVPWLVWRIVHAVIGKPNKIEKPDSITFDIFQPLLLKAAKDEVLTRGKSKETKVTRLDQAVKILGHDIAAAVCMIHSVCRKVKSAVSERVWKPILDDALIRAQIGFYVGSKQTKFGSGRGMLAGFSGRSGLAILIAQGAPKQAQHALEGLAKGSDMRDVGLKVYGCDPLQVSAMTLSAGGCSMDAAFGVASFNLAKRASDSNIFKDGSQLEQWLTVFAMSEYLRIGEPKSISDHQWKLLDWESEADQGELRQYAQKLTKKGHSMSWIIKKQDE
jgi:hypothetical protein